MQTASAWCGEEEGRTGVGGSHGRWAVGAVHCGDQIPYFMLAVHGALRCGQMHGNKTKT